MLPVNMAYSQEGSMRGRHSTMKIQLDPQTRTLLQSWLHRQKTPLGQARRTQAMLLLEQGHPLFILLLHALIFVAVFPCRYRQKLHWDRDEEPGSKEARASSYRLRSLKALPLPI